MKKIICMLLTICMLSGSVTLVSAAGSIMIDAT